MTKLAKLTNLKDLVKMVKFAMQIKSSAKVQLFF